MLRDAMIVVMLVGVAGMLLILALAATKHHESTRRTLERRERQRLAEPGAGSDPAGPSDRSEAAVKTAVDKRFRRAFALVAFALLSGTIVGALIANALDIHGGERILVQMAAVYLATWCSMAPVLLVSRRRDRAAS